MFPTCAIDIMAELGNTRVLLVGTGFRKESLANLPNETSA
jgi:hypothetical protein